LLSAEAAMRRCRPGARTSTARMRRWRAQTKPTHFEDVE
jgi:hypothetical protein